MAIKVQGTTVIDDSRDISNIGIATVGILSVGSYIYDANGVFGTTNQVLTSVPGIGVSWADESGGGSGGDKIEEGNTSAEVVDTGSDGHFKVTTEGIERLRIDSSGNLGIGITNPDGKLDVLFDTSAGNRHFFTKDGLGVRLQRRGDTVAWAMDYGFETNNGTDVGGFGAYGTNAGLNRYYIGSSYQDTKFVIESGGDVGIGTDNPQNKLDVRGDIRIQDSIPTILFRSPDGSSNQYYIGANISDSVNGGLIIGEGSGITGGTRRISINSSGNVGIGTNVPSVKLHVHSGSVRTTNTAKTNFTELGTDGNIELKRSGGGAYIDFADLTSDDFDVRIQESNDGLTFITGGNGSTTEKVRITSAGDVGIGTDSPAAKLDVIASGAVAAHIRSSDGGSRVGLIVDGDNEGSDVLFKARSNTTATPTDADIKFIITGPGDVGINSTAPTARLDVNGTLNVTGVSTFQDNVNLGDDDRLRLGDDQDLQIWHSGLNSFIRDIGTGDLLIRSNGSGVRIGKDNGDDMGVFNTDGAVELYHANSKKFETTSQGALVTGSIDLTSELNFTGPAAKFVDFYTKDSGGTAYSANLRLVNHDSSSFHNAVKMIRDGAVELYHNNSKKFETTGYGVTVSGGVYVSGISTFQGDAYFGDNDQLRLGDDEDLLIYHGGLHSYIRDTGTGNLLIRSDGDGVKIQKEGGDNMGVFNTDGAVELYHANSKKFETTADGIKVRPNVGLGTVQGNSQDLAVFQTTNGISNTSDLRIVEARDINGTSWTSAYTRIQKRIDVTDQAYIQFNGSGLTYGLEIGNAANNEIYAQFRDNSSVDLFYNGVKKFETTGIGVSIVGTGNTATITGPSNLVLDPAAVGDNTGTVTILGNLQVDGTQTIINSTTMTVDDLNITLASGAANASAANGAGLTVDGASATLTYSSTGDSWVFNKAPYYNTNRILTTADEGTGNGLDADTVDGIQASSFLRSDAADTATGAITFSGGQTWNSHITWNAGQNIYIAGESSFDIQSGGQWQVWDTSSSNNWITASYGQPLVLNSNALNTIVKTSGNTDYFRIYHRTDTDITMDFYCESQTTQIADTFGGISDKKYILFGNPNGSSDPGYIMHETRGGGESNEGVLHLCPSDDNAYNDYVSIHGTNDPDQLRLHTSGLIESVSSQLQLASGSGGIYLNDDVGIGTDSPAAKLDVTADGIVAAHIRSSDGGSRVGLIVDGDNEGGDVLFKARSNTTATPTDADIKFIITGPGDVGINTTTPGSTLAVGGTITELYNGTYWNVVTQADVGYGASQVPLNQYLGQLAFLDDYHPNGLRRDGGGSDDVFVTSAGDVGIGTVTPAANARLHIVDDANVGGIALGNAQNIEAATLFSNYNSFQISADQYIYLRPNNTTAVTLNPSGNVGIGTDNPTEKLDVRGHIKVDNGPTLDHGGGSELQITTDYGYVRVGPRNSSWSHFYTDRNQYYFDKRIAVDTGQISSYNDDIAFFTDEFNTERLRILASNGYVGINTTSPSYQLHVNGSFAATTKSFVIDHPTKEGMKLRYGSLEGPENGVYVRGRLKDNNTIELPDHWTGLVDEETITVNLTPIGRKAPLHSVVDIVDNTVVVESANDVVDCFYTVFGERKDVEKLEVEF